MFFLIRSNVETTVAESHFHTILWVFQKGIDLVFQLLMVNVERTENFTSAFGGSLKILTLAVPSAIVDFQLLNYCINNLFSLVFDGGV